MTEPTITQAEALADAICGCANREQHRRDVALIEAYREAAVAELRAENERLRKEQAILIKVMDAADRYNGVHTQSQQPMARMQGALMLAIQRAYRELGLSRDDLSRAALSQKETSHDD